MKSPDDDRQLLEMARARAGQLVQRLQESAGDARQFAATLSSPPSAQDQVKVIGAALDAAQQTLAALQAAAAMPDPNEDEAV